MKKALSLILVLVLCLSLCACGGGAQAGSDNAAVEKVIDMIDALEVSLTSKKAIESAEAAYAQLTDAQKSAVTNYQSLVDARASYDRILNVFALIEAIGTVNENSEPAIIAAEKAYNELSIEERIAITNASVLTAARTAFDAIPTEVTLTIENVMDYFTFENTYSTSREKLYGSYGVKIIGSVLAKQSATLAGMENVTFTVRVTYTVGRPVDGSLDAEEEYQTYYYDVEISVSATSGNGSASYSTDGHLVSPYWYPSVELASVEVIAVTGTVTVD